MSGLPVCDCVACIDVSVGGGVHVSFSYTSWARKMAEGFSLTPSEEGLVQGREEASLAQFHPVPTWEQ